MKVLAINNGKDKTAYTLIEGTKGRYLTYSDFLKGNITEEIKELCRRFQPDEIVLQLPPTGLHNNTRRAIQEGFGRNVAATFSLRRSHDSEELTQDKSSIWMLQASRCPEFLRTDTFV